MNMKCLFKGHEIEGCRCIRCGKSFPKLHKIEKGHCVYCSTHFHEMDNHCKCKYCGEEFHHYVRKSESSWNANGEWVGGYQEGGTEHIETTKTYSECTRCGHIKDIHTEETNVRYTN